MRSPEARRAALAAGLGLAFVLVVVLVSAAIRLNSAELSPTPVLGETGLKILRGIHRSAASLEVLVALWLAWIAWRRGGTMWQAIGVVLALTVFLSVLGIVAGRTPSSLQALGNVLGGLALAAAFAWVLGAGYRDGPRFMLGALLVLVSLLALQSVIGARLSIFGRVDLPALPLHALLGLLVAALLAWLALARVGGRAGKAFFVLALAAPIAGFTALQYEHSVAAALVHAASAAALAVGAAFALSRNA